MHFQNDNVDAKGKLRGAVPLNVFDSVYRAADAARRSGVPVVHVRLTFESGYPGINDASPPILRSVKRLAALREHSWGAEFHPAVAPREGDVVVTQHGMSALAGTDLRSFLPARGIDTLVLCGVSTNVVITGTVWEAAFEGYTAIVVKDGCYATSDDAHALGLQVLSALATLVTAEEFVAAL
jgi:nicotinamidase-related amidase